MSWKVLETTSRQGRRFALRKPKAADAASMHKSYLNDTSASIHRNGELSGQKCLLLEGFECLRRVVAVCVSLVGNLELDGTLSFLYLVVICHVHEHPAGSKMLRAPGAAASAGIMMRAQPWPSTWEVSVRR